MKSTFAEPEPPAIREAREQATKREFAGAR